jgi:hypothetical protein
VSTGTHYRWASAAVAALLVVLVLVAPSIAARGRRGARLATAPALTAVLALTALVSFNGQQFFRYRQNGDENALSRAWAADGVRLKYGLPPGTRMAAFGIGNITYFSGLPMVDMLGKVDRTIARSRPHSGPFLAGHMKWNYSYSLGHLRPDVVFMQAMVLSAQDKSLITHLGYRPLVPGCGALGSLTLGLVYVRDGEQFCR